MATAIDLHGRSSDMDDPLATSPTGSQSCVHHATNTATSSPPQAFPVTPHDVTEPEGSLEKTIEPLQSEALLSAPLTVISTEFQQRSNGPIDSYPKNNVILTSQTPQSPDPPSLSTTADPSSPSIAQSDCKRPLTPTDATQPVHAPSSVRSEAYSDLDPNDFRTHPVKQDPPIEAFSHRIATTSLDNHDLNHISSASILPGATTVADNTTIEVESTTTAPPEGRTGPKTPTCSNSRLTLHSPDPISTDHPDRSTLTPTHAVAERSPTHLDKTSSINLIVTSKAALTSTGQSHSELGEEPDDRLGSPNPSRPLDPVPIANSNNSLSPLSDVPSGPSPGHVVESPSNGRSPKSAFSPRTSPVSFKRQSSPSSYENGVVPRADGSSSHSHRTTLDSSRSSAHKRPRLVNDLSSNSHLKSPHHPNHQSTLTFLDPHQPVHPRASTGTFSSQSMTEGPSGFIPGTPGTRFTKDQQRFAISVTKQLKKHRSAGPFLVAVDPVALQIPDYLEVIKHPMDLSTIETRLGKVGKPCFYRSVEDFVSDVQLVFSNCYTYNGPPATSTYSRMALDLSIQFETQMKKMPLDEPVSHPSTSRSPSLAKPPPKTKQNVDLHSTPTIIPKQNASSLALSSSVSAPPPIGGQKRRSSSPQHSRKKTAKATSVSASAFQDVDSFNAQLTSRASLNDSSQRSRPDIRGHYSHDISHHAFSGPEPSLIPNTKAELKFCKEVLREFNKKAHEQYAWPFYHPVDIVKLGIPDYPKYVKRPMDMDTMNQKLKEGKYKNGAAFAEDFRLMLNNCFIFNPRGSMYYEHGKKLESAFEAKWAERPPDQILAPTLPHASIPSPSEPSLDPLQELRMQVAVLQERLDASTRNPRGSISHAIPGTGPPKKQSASRGAGQPKSLSTSSSTEPLPLGAAPLATPKSGKANGSGLGKAKQAHGGARRKSGGSAALVSSKQQSQFLEQPLPESRPDPSQSTQQPYQPTPLPPDTNLPPTSFPLSTSTRRLSEHEYFEKINYEQKKDLATQIQNAVEPMQSDAINLIRNSRPDLVAADGEEIELDIDALDDRTLYQLYQLVCVPPPPPPKAKKLKAATNGKPKGSRKTAPGGPRKSTNLAMSSHPTLTPQVLGERPPEQGTWPPGAQSANGNGNGNGNSSKPKTKKPRANPPGPKRKGIDETQEAARIRDLEEKLHVFQGVTDPHHPSAVNHTNGVTSINPAPGSALNAPPPAGPVEYASSSSESDSETDDESD